MIDGVLRKYEIKYDLVTLRIIIPDNKLWIVVMVI